MAAAAAAAAGQQNGNAEPPQHMFIMLLVCCMLLAAVSGVPRARCMLCVIDPRKYMCVVREPLHKICMESNTLHKWRDLHFGQRAVGSGSFGLRAGRASAPPFAK